MEKTFVAVARLGREEEGQDLIEYALLASFIGLATAAATGLVGVSLSDWYMAVSGSIDLFPTSL